MEPSSPLNTSYDDRSLTSPEILRYRRRRVVDLEISQAALTSKLQSYADEVANLKVALKTKETAQVNQAAQLNYYREKLKTAKANGAVEFTTKELQEQLNKANADAAKLEKEYISSLSELQERCAILENQKEEADNRSFLLQAENLRLKSNKPKPIAAGDDEKRSFMEALLLIEAERDDLRASLDSITRAKDEVDRELLVLYISLPPS